MGGDNDRPGAPARPTVPMLIDASQLDWPKVEAAANKILAFRDSARYAAPELQHELVVKVAAALTTIADALLITPPEVMS